MKIVSLQGCAFPAGEEGGNGGGFFSKVGDAAKNALATAGENEVIKTVAGWAGVDTSKLDLNTTLASLNIDQAIITNLTTTFTDPHQLFSLFTQPEKLKAELTEKTGMDEQTITGFVDTIKTWK